MTMVARSEDYKEALKHQASGRLADAQKICEDILKVQPENPDALHLLGVLVFQLNNPERSIDLINRAIEIHPDNADYHCDLGIVQAALGQLGAANISYDKAIAIRPEFAQAYNNRGLVQAATAQSKSAIESYNKALEFIPNFAAAYCNRGIAHTQLRKYELAIVDFNKAISIQPRYGEAYCNLGFVQERIGQPNVALENYNKAIEILPNYDVAYYNRGNVLKSINKHSAAINSYEKAMQIRPDFPFLSGTLLHTKMEICDWEDLEAHQNALLSQVEQGKKASRPLDLHNLFDSPSLHKLATEAWMQSKHPRNTSLGEITKKPICNKIRIGYYSADFREHAVSHLSVDIFESHNRNKFELIAFSYRPEVNDGMYKRVQGAFDQFIEVRNQSDLDIAKHSRDLGIDIAVDLGGLTSGHRPGVFSYRAAPIQVSYLGYGGTMACEYYDYLMADETIIPREHQNYYSEKIVYLPSYQTSALHRARAQKKLTRQELGLPESGFIFCCFNNNIKITPSIFSTWMRILEAVEGSILFLNASNAVAIENIKKEALSHRINPDRIIFKKFLPRAEHLATYGIADLFLDTFPYNAATTANDALWSGLPLLTLVGKSFVSRVGASALNVLQLPELISYSQAEYESRAIELAKSPDQLLDIRKKLQANRTRSPLFDPKHVTKYIESAYIKMHEHYRSALPPEHIWIAED